MVTCPFCRRDVRDLGKHYGSNNCPSLVGALGEIQDKQIEYEKTGGKPRQVICECGQPAVKSGRCETCYKLEQNRLMAIYREKNREALRAKQRERYYAKAG